MIFASTGDIVPLPSMVVPSLGTTGSTNDVGGKTAVAASVDKSVNFIILTLVVLSLYSTVQQQ